MSFYYILDKDGNPVAENNSLAWAQWFENFNDNRRIALTELDDYVFSTVFLGLDHNFMGDGEPILFETMVFDKEWHSLYMRRYCTKKQAEDGHKEIVMYYLEAGKLP